MATGLSLSLSPRIPCNAVPEYRVSGSGHENAKLLQKHISSLSFSPGIFQSTRNFPSGNDRFPFVRRVRETSSRLISEILGWTPGCSLHGRKSGTRSPTGAQFTRSISRYDTQFHGLPKGSLEHCERERPRGNYPFLGD